MSKLIECVPNFSEGRDRKKIDAIVAAIAAVPGVTMLDVDPGEATHRTVVTFVAPSEAVVEGAYAGIAKAAELIDMRTHTGAHARQGATDVCPFVPISDVTVAECVDLARTLAKRVGETLAIPVYLYEAAATRPERKSLADIRAGEYEALEEKLTRPEFVPDFGPCAFNAKAGATTIGVRPFLIAYNINLSTRNEKIAKDIGLGIREKGRAKRDATGKKNHDATGELIREPGFAHCRATGWYIPEYRRAQVTMNLTDFTVTPIHVVFDRVVALAAAEGVRVTGSEVVGLVPKSAIVDAGKHYLQLQGLSTGFSERALIDAAILALGLDEVAPFDPAQKIIEYRVQRPGRLVSLSVADFVEELGSDAPAPGGGSVAALAGAMSGALTAMVAALTYGKKGYLEHEARMAELGAAAHKLKEQLLRALDEDTIAFDQVLASLRLPKQTDEQKRLRDEAIQAANRGAARIPLAVLEVCPELLALAEEVASKGNQNSLSDAGVAGLMARAAAYGAAYNVLINLQGIADKGWCDVARARSDQLLAQVIDGSQRLEALLMQRLRGTM